MKKKQIIFYELNEVPEIIFERFRSKSNKFNKLLEKFSFYRTISKDNCVLSPWITWSTVHRGVTFKKHKIENLGQDVHKQNIDYPPIWMDLKKKGLSVGVFGSMHSNQLPQDFLEYDFYIPDPFADHSKCNPKSLEPIQEFQLNLTRGSSRNVKKSFFKELSFKFFISLFKSGVKIKTYFLLLKQILHEKIDKKKLNRRRVYQSVINFDIYLKLLKLRSPSFSSFFTNHVASSMHRYWEAAYPKDFKGKNKQDLIWIKSYKNEIDFAMQAFERQLSSLVKYAEKNENCEIWICTSMGQGPVINYSPVEFQLYITHPQKLIEFLNLNPMSFEIKPAMMPRWTLKGNKKDIKDLSNAIKELLIDGNTCEQMLGENSLTIKIECINKIPIIIYRGKKIDFKKIGLEIINVDDKSGSSAYHIPEGVLMIYGQDSERYRKKSLIPTNHLKGLIVNSF